MFRGGGTEDPDKIPAQTTLSDVFTQVRRRYSWEEKNCTSGTATILSKIPYTFFIYRPLSLKYSPLERNYIKEK